MLVRFGIGLWINFVMASIVIGVYFSRDVLRDSKENVQISIRTINHSPKSRVGYST
jgi:hypothetical protein